MKNVKYFAGGRGAALVFLSLRLECSGEIGASNLGNASAKSSNCPEMSLMIYEARKKTKKNQPSDVFQFLKAEPFIPGWKMMVLRTQLDQGDDFALPLFPCFSIVVHFCSHLIPRRLIVK